MKALKCAETHIEIHFTSQKEADIVLSAIKPEIIDLPSHRTFTGIECEDRTLIITIKAKDSPSLRASLNSYLRWIMLSKQVLNLSK